MAQTTTETFLRAASALLDLPVRDEHFAEVLAAFEVMAAQARLIGTVSLPAAIEPAPRFVP
jgi:hypothetical protein